MCGVLEEMRHCCKTLNFASLPGLIEEVQSMANRMESALSDQRDIASMNAEWHRLRDEIKAMQRKKKK